MMLISDTFIDTSGMETGEEVSFLEVSPFEPSSLEVEGLDVEDVSDVFV